MMVIIILEMPVIWHRAIAESRVCEPEMQASEGMPSVNQVIYDSTGFAQVASVNRVDTGERRLDTAFAHVRTMWIGTAGLLASNDLRFVHGTAWLAAHLRNRGNERISSNEPVAVRVLQDDRERNSLRVEDEAALAAKLAPIRGAQASLCPASIARVDGPLTMARATLSRPQRPDSTRSVSSMLFPISPFGPATSCSQQAVREPQTISYDNKFRTIPERRTNTMPASTTPSSIKSHPAYPRMRGDQAGSNGPISDRYSSFMKF
ncbi:hypothetical protein PQQ63_27905 [Paraburkholderia metrosideri]|uniref:Uncharacterized protein n=1 Tax=Paraburkholderia metrosideri TaxID=580937 RepID=A0ABW9E052_9BURK